MIHIPELLCPVGEFDALRAAVCSGADAVYLGTSTFGARASAVNFDESTLIKAVNYAHLHHVRVYVTVNTLIKPSEMPSLLQTLDVIRDAHADAVIVQDLGVAAIARDQYPSLALHASTQMALRSQSDASFAKSLGFERVVLARECSLAEMKQAQKAGVELEVFVHGALCTSVSGQCLLSSMAGGRSGNRGRCAQPCRQDYRLPPHNAAFLSMKDLCLYRDLSAVVETGVHSLKVEGRLKNPAYVAVVADVYRHALDDIAKGSFEPSGRDFERLLQAFHRGGFTRGHAMGEEDADLISPQRVGHGGVSMGRIVQVSANFARIRTNKTLNDGDSLQIHGMKDMDMRYAGNETLAGSETLLRLRPDMMVDVGNEVYRLTDATELDWANKQEEHKIPVQMTGTMMSHQPMTLTLSDGTSTVTVSGDIIAPAQKSESTREQVIKQLSKLGNTPFVLGEDIRLVLKDRPFLPTSALNALRRDAVDALIQKRIADFSTTPIRNVEKQSTMTPSVHFAPDTLAVQFRDADHATALQQAGASLLLFEPCDLSPKALERDLSILPDGCYLVLPNGLCEDDLSALLPVLLAYQAKLGGLVANAYGQLTLPLDLPIIAGQHLPITNQEALHTLRTTRAQAFTLWAEWTKTDQQAFLPSPLPAFLLVYGYQQVMQLNHCPKRAMLGLHKQRESCTLCEDSSMVCGTKNAYVVDRKNYRFPLIRTHQKNGCLIRMLGSLPTMIPVSKQDLQALNAFALLHFTIEPLTKQLDILRHFASPSASLPPCLQNTTKGHWQRGVE